MQRTQQITLIVSIVCLVFSIGGVILTTVPAAAQSVKGKTLRFSYGGAASYHADGSYSYRHPNGKIDRGNWTQTGNRVCITFRSGRNRCDTIEGRTLINSRGERYDF